MDKLSGCAFRPDDEARCPAERVHDCRERGGESSSPRPGYGHNGQRAGIFHGSGNSKLSCGTKITSK